VTAHRPGADGELPQLVDRGDLPEESLEVFGVDEAAVPLEAVVGDDRHRPFPYRLALGGKWGLQGARLPHRRRHQLQVVLRHLRPGVAVVEDLALFGDPDPPPHSPRWLRQQRFVRGTAAPRHRAPTTVEQSETDAGAVTDEGQL